MIKSFVASTITDLSQKTWKVQIANGFTLGMSFTEIESVLKIVLLVASIGLTCITAYFKIKKNGGDRE